VSVAAQLRPGRPSDAADLAALIDMASRGLINWFWSTLCGPGESALEKGRTRIRNNTDSLAHWSQWTVADAGGDVAGAYTGHFLTAPHTDDSHAEVYVPMLELESLVEGSWYLMALAVFEEHQRKGLGALMLADAEKQARKAGASLMSLLVESVNVGAVRFYRCFGFQELARRAYIPFPGSRDAGDWILLTKEVAR
jgi:ribosomal protein S18 acetylase RimI-like enzyme